MTQIVKLLEQHGPMISSDLVSLLSKQLDIPSNTASQRVVRSKEIKKISGFFQSNQSLCYLESHVEEGVLFDSLAKAMFERGHKYWYCLNAVRMHGGIISRRFLECYTNYPVINLKKHLPFDAVLRKFVSQGILVYKGGDYLFSPKFHDLPVNPLAHNAIEIIKEGVLNDFHSLARNIGLISYYTGEHFPEFGKFRWAFKGLSPVIGLKQGDQHGYLIADILLGNSIFKEDVAFFIEKLKHIQSFKNASRLIPFLLVDDLDKEALDILKKYGVVVGFINELLGSKYAETLRELISILKNAGASLKNNPEKYLELIQELKKYNEGLANNIRGTLFEYVVGHIHSGQSKTIDLGRDIFESNGRHEIDVLAVYDDKVVIAECKGKMSPVKLDVVEDWIQYKIPAFRKWCLKQETWRQKDIEFEFWSTAGFDDDAQKVLEDKVASTKKYKVSFFGPKELRQRAIAMKNKKLKEALDNYFLKPKV